MFSAVNSLIFSMPLDLAEIKPFLPDFSQELLQVIAADGNLMDVPAGMEILKEGQYVRMIPIVLQGLVKVFTRVEEKELLLYYIGSTQSCIMSFSAGLSQSPSRIYAISEDSYPQTKSINGSGNFRH